MAKETTNVSIRMDREVKEAADKLFKELGINTTAAINMFLRQSIRLGKIPFELSLNSDSKNSEKREV